MMVFPSNVVDRKRTINGARGGAITGSGTAFDLTVECIRLHYEREPSPLGDTLSRYASFFALFENFRGYVDFFLLQNMVADEYSAIRFHVPFEGFDKSPIPADLDAYLSYRQLSTQFIDARNERIRAWVPLGA